MLTLDLSRLALSSLRQAHRPQRLDTKQCDAGRERQSDLKWVGLCLLSSTVCVVIRFNIASREQQIFMLYVFHPEGIPSEQTIFVLLLFSLTSRATSVMFSSK